MTVKDKIKRTVYFHPVTWARLVVAARHYEVSVSNLVRSAVDEWIDREYHNDTGAFNEGEQGDG